MRSLHFLFSLPLHSDSRELCLCMYFSQLKHNLKSALHLSSVSSNYCYSVGQLAWLQGQSIMHDGFDLCLLKLNFISSCDVPLFVPLHFRGEHRPISQWVSLPEDIDGCFYFSSFSTAYFFQGAFVILLSIFFVLLVLAYITHVRNCSQVWWLLTLGSEKQIGSSERGLFNMSHGAGWSGSSISLDDLKH